MLPHREHGYCHRLARLGLLQTEVLHPIAMHVCTQASGAEMYIILTAAMTKLARKENLPLMVS